MRALINTLILGSILVVSAGILSVALWITFSKALVVALIIMSVAVAAMEQ